MAIRKMADGVTTGWNNKMPFPKDRYTITCIEETFDTSKSSGNPMLTQTWEIVAPEFVEQGDRKINVAGAKITRYCTTKVKSTKEELAEGAPEWNAEKSDKAWGRYHDELIMLGYDDQGEVDDKNPPCFHKGKTVDAIVYAKADVARKSPTPEMLRKGIRQGEAIKDSEGNDVVTYQLNIETILGLAAKGPNVAF
jgi:hypothetical protein